MQFNQYSMYSYAAADFKSACNDKILVDLQRLDKIDELCRLGVTQQNSYDSTCLCEEG